MYIKSRGNRSGHGNVDRVMRRGKGHEDINRVMRRGNGHEDRKRL